MLQILKKNAKNLRFPRVFELSVWGWKLKMESKNTAFQFLRTCKICKFNRWESRSMPGFSTSKPKISKFDYRRSTVKKTIILDGDSKSSILIFITKLSSNIEFRVMHSYEMRSCSFVLSGRSMIYFWSLQAYLVQNFLYRMYNTVEIIITIYEQCLGLWRAWIIIVGKKGRVPPSQLTTQIAVRFFTLHQNNKNKVCDVGRVHWDKKKTLGRYL